MIEGLGLLDVTTTRGPVRAVGEILTRWRGRDGDDALLTGFENHGGYTRLGSSATPLADVEVGVGNAADGTEGAVSGTVIGTYPHGPVLARNPALADHVLQLALGEELAPASSARDRRAAPPAAGGSPSAIADPDLRWEDAAAQQHDRPESASPRSRSWTWWPSSPAGKSGGPDLPGAADAVADLAAAGRARPDAIVW